MISDVIGDPLDLIASGPTVADPSRFKDAWRIFERFDLIEQVPPTVLRHLQRGMFGDIPETPKPGEAIFALAHHHIVANNQIALRAAQSKAESLGYRASVESTMVQGEAREFATTLVGIVNKAMDDPNSAQRPMCILFGGETTVTVRGEGLGGRCQEIALAALANMSDATGDYVIAACGTDGTDGPTDAAGGFACREVAGRAKELGLSPMEFLERNNSYNFLCQTDGLIVTGPTGTNVMDVYLALIP
jgi:hydroxypyruvate reductase